MGRSKELVKNTAILTFGKMCTQFISFLLLPLYTALLNTEEFGVVDLFTTFISLLLPLVCWQFDQGLFRFMLDMRGEDQKIRKLFSSVAVMNVLQCLGMTGILLVVQIFVKSEYFAYLVIGVILNVFSGLLMQFARGLGKMLRFSVGSFLSASGTVVLNVLLIVVLRMGAHGMFIAMLGGLVVNCLYLFFTLRVWKYFDFRLFDRALIKEVCGYSIPLVPNQISGWVLSASNRVIISAFIDVAANGVFAVANKFSNLVGTFYGFFNMAWVETVSLHFEDSDRDRFISEMIQKVLGIFITVCVGVSAVMPFIFSIMVDAQFGAAYQQIPILMISVIFQVLIGLYSAIYIALKKSATIAKTTIVGAVINVLIHLVLIPFVGLYAASIATMLSYAVVAVYRKFDVQKFVNLKFDRWFLVLSTGMVVLTTVSYYVNHLALNCVTLAAVIAAAFVLNREIVMKIFQVVKKLLTKSC